MKQKAFTIALIFLVGSSLLFTTSFLVNAQIDVTILSVTSQGLGVPYVTVDQFVTVSGNIITNNGQYILRFADVQVASGSAIGYDVVVNVTVPEYFGGNLGFVLVDVATGSEASYPLPLRTDYIIKPIVPESPRQLREGETVPLNVSITAGTINTTYAAEILVTSPTGENYTRTLTFTSSSRGTAQTTINFPDSSFSPSGSTTIYAGTYSVYFNASSSLGQSFFRIGFTELTTYHRGETVNVRALGYQPGQQATVAFNLNDAVFEHINATASSQGEVIASWVVPSNAPVGAYEVVITPLTTPSKAVVDIQDIAIPGYTVAITPLNLANEPVVQVLVEAEDQATGTVYNATTNSSGIAILNLEAGEYDVSVFWNQVNVGQASITVSGAGSHSVSCQLTNLIIRVQDKNGVVIPFADLSFNYQYTTRTGASQSGSANGQTGISGVFTLSSTLPGITYSVAASKYGQVFNEGNGTIGNLPAQPSSEYIILCPDETLSLTTVDYSFTVLPNARIILIEQASGIFYSVTTDSNGNAQLQVTFGQYQAEVYTSTNVLINETVIEVLSNTNEQIHCVLYNLPISVRVVDYFGNGINNVDVELSRPGADTRSATTQADGTAVFPDAIGGDMQIVAYVPGSQGSFVAKNLRVDSPETIELPFNKSVVLAGVVVDTSMFATLIIVVLVLLLFVGVELVRRGTIKLPRRG